MADLWTVDGWLDPGSLGALLRDALPDDYSVVEAPALLGGQGYDVVLGPQGLFLLLSKPWRGEITPAAKGPWQVRLPSGEPGSYPNPAGEAQQAAERLRAFLAGEFPTVQPPIHPLLLLTEPDARLAPGSAPNPLVVTPANVPAVILATAPTAGGPLGDRQRDEIAAALRENRLTSDQRTAQPFIFRSGRLLGSGQRVWTLREAVAHMDRHPQDGIYHLSNGTLAGWLEEQGAPRLAVLAREVVDSRETDPRVALERFLLGTGLAARPVLTVRPQPLNLGCVVSGKTCTASVRVSKGRGRGYLFGSLRSSEPWLRVEPNSFSGQTVQVVVSADTAALPISPTPWQADLLIYASDASAPLVVPVRVKVAGEPSTLNRLLLRPLMDLAAAGLIGAALGWLLGASGLLGAPWGVVSPQLFWALAVGGLWALFGLLRALSQRPAWTPCYATGRFLLRLATWMAGVFAAAALGASLWGLITGQAIPALPVALLLTTLAIIPATLAERRAARQAGDTPLAAQRGALLRPLAWAVAVIALVALLAGGVRLAGPAWQSLDASGATEATQSWVNERWSQLEAAADDLADRWYLWRHGQRTQP